MSWLNKKVILKLGSRSLYHAELYAKQLPCAYMFSICEILGLCHFCRLWGVKSINNSSEKGSKFSGEEGMEPRAALWEQALLHRLLCVPEAPPWEHHSTRTCWCPAVCSSTARAVLWPAEPPADVTLAHGSMLAWIFSPRFLFTQGAKPSVKFLNLNMRFLGKDSNRQW